MSLMGQMLTRAAAAGPDLSWDSERGFYPLLVNDPTRYQNDGRTVRLIGFESHSVVSPCIRLIAEQFAAVPWEVFTTDSDGNTEAVGPDHPAQQLFDNPAGTISPHKTRMLLALHYVTYGNGLQWIVRKGFTNNSNGTGPPIRLVPIHPEYLFNVTLTSDGYDVLDYRWTDVSGHPHASPTLDIIHTADSTLNPDWWFGYPRGAAAILEMYTDTDMSNFVREIYANHGVPLAVVLTQSTDRAALKAAEERWDQRSGKDRGNRGRMRFMAGATDVKVLGFDMRSMEGPEMRAIMREGICACFGVDPRMIGIGSASSDGGLSGQQYVEARRKLWSQTILPIAISIFGQYNFWLMPEYGENLGVRFSPAALADILEDEKETSDRIIAEVGATIRTVEEGRKVLRLPAEMASEDHVVLPLGREVMTVDEAQEAPEPMPLPLLNASETDEPEEAEDDEAERGSRNGNRLISSSNR